MDDLSPSIKGDILVVDDMADNLRLLATLLTERGYKVRKVIQGELALGVAQVNPPDLILLDIVMPKLNGFEICQQLKANPQTQEIPIIFLSASDEPLDKVKAFSVGGEDYITKPFEILEVIARIENQLRIVRLQQKLLAQNYQLQQEVRERQRAEQSLQEINQHLEERVSRRTQELTQANQKLQGLGEQLQIALAQEQELSAPCSVFCQSSRVEPPDRGD
ncbi:response regulator [Prochlorothrix hollandica]|uniref:response regulator n=1 Tax=Prochlorothrix hollandica TaxID=1223 RepID=UPI0033408DA2